MKHFRQGEKSYPHPQVPDIHTEWKQFNSHTVSHCSPHDWLIEVLGTIKCSSNPLLSAFKINKQ